jgi:hypothetical protein
LYFVIVYFRLRIEFKQWWKADMFPKLWKICVDSEIWGASVTTGMGMEARISGSSEVESASWFIAIMFVVVLAAGGMEIKPRAPAEQDVIDQILEQVKNQERDINPLKTKRICFI